ncbi:MAG: MBL fold metallo-hydrolase [Coprobacillus sp.]|nr:MBL fold metallo-hydrolase [Coprobacillus sp.]
MKLLLIFLVLWAALCIRYYPIVLVLVVLVLLIYAFKRYKKKFGCILLVVIGVGIGYSFVDFDITKEDGIYNGIVIESKDNYFIFYTNLERVYVYNQDNTYEVGDFLSISGSKETFSSTTLESQFDFEAYLNKKGVDNALNANEITVKWSFPIRINSLKKNFLSHFDEETQNFISSLFFSTSADSNLSTSLTNLHLSRFASASGVYIYPFLSLFSFIFGMFMKKKWAKALSFGVLLPYFILLFPRFSIIRICSLYIFRLINEYCLHKRFSTIETTAIVGIVCLLLNHYLARQDSFILGFSLPLAYSVINNLSFRIKGRVKRRVVSTLIFGIFFIPFEMSFYSSVNLFTYPLTILLEPFFVILSLLTLLSYYRVPIYSAVNGYTHFLDNICSGLMKVNPSAYAPPVGVAGTIIYFVLFFVLIYFLLIRHRPMLKITGSVFALFVISLITPLDNTFSCEVMFINVGQGDATLVRSHNSAVLIDTGGLYYTDVATDILIPLFKKEKIYSLDCVFLTHDDFDHDGACDSLCENFTVKNVMSYYDNYPVTYGGVTYYNYNDEGYMNSEENDKSLVLGFNIMDMDFVIMGDATMTIEYEIMEKYDHIDCDILKVGHHGSKTSTSPEWVSYLSPQEAIISCGLNNRYGHPASETLETLYEAGVNIRRTDLEGSIRYYKLCLW